MMRKGETCSIGELLKQAKCDLSACVDTNVEPLFGYPTVQYSRQEGGEKSKKKLSTIVTSILTCENRFQYLKMALQSRKDRKGTRNHPELLQKTKSLRVERPIGATKVAVAVQPETSMQTANLIKWEREMEKNLKTVRAFLQRSDEKLHCGE